jgi:uncharacterized damage-inducible protein DinB
MEPAAGALFLDFSARKLEQLCGRIGECVARLNAEQVWRRSGDSDNAVGNLLLHLSGNLGQWIIAGIGGKPDVRVRDREFSARGELEPSELMQRLESAVTEAAAVIRAVNPDRLMETFEPQNYRVTVLEGVYHVVEHFSGHTGQVIFATKLLTGQDLGFYKHLSRPAAHGEKTP